MRLRSIGWRGLTVALVFLVAMALLGWAAPPPAEAGSFVLSPKRGASYGSARRIVLRVRSGYRATVRVKLNGVRSTDEFRNPNRRVHRLSLSPNHGLRHGRNRLRVRVRRFHAKRWRSRRLRFRVRGARLLAAAGRDLAASPGAAIRLDGTRSRAGGRRARLRFRWSVVGHPPQAASAAGPAPLAAARLTRSRSRRPRLVVRRTGRYRVRLRVRTPNGRRRTDFVTIRSDPPPALRLDTMAKQGGRWGIRVGEDFYPADPGAWLQVVVIDRALGTLRSNTSYRCVDPINDAAPCIGAVRGDLAKLGPDALVIASNQPEDGGKTAAPVNAPQALSALKPPRAVFPTGAYQLVRGTYSAVGQVGGPTTANATARDNSPGGGRIDDLLIRNNRLNYALSPAKEVSYETEAPGSGPDASVIRVGDETYEHSGATLNGFHVVVLDRYDLKGTEYWFQTGGKKGPAALGVIGQMRNVLRAANNSGDKLVILLNHGFPNLDPKAYEGLAESHQLYNAISDTATEIQRLGGSRTRFFNLIDAGLRPHPYYHYTLVGASGLGPGHGTQSFSPRVAATPSRNSAPLRGTFVRSRSDYSFERGLGNTALPLDSSAPPNPSARLLETVNEPETPWPEQGDAGREAAVALVGTRAGLSSDPRSQYYTRPYTDGTWEQTKALIKSLEPTNLPANVSADDFKWAQGELATEIGWLEGAHGYIETLAQPYAAMGLSSWADLQKIAEQINDDVKAQAKDTAAIAANDIFNDLLGFADDIPEIGAFLDVAAKIYESAVQIAELASGEGKPGIGNKFNSTVATVGADLAERLADGEETLTVRYANVVAADYGKLRTVATCGALGTPDCPGDPGQWQLTQDDQDRLGRALRGQFEATFYGSLLPAKYDLWKVANDGQSSLLRNITDPADYYGQGFAGFGTFFPFKGIPASAQFASPICRDLGDHQRSSWQVWALGHLKGEGNVANPWSMSVPAHAATDRLLEPVNPQTFPEGGLGVLLESFYLSNYERPKGFYHYPLASSQMFWKGDQSPYTYCNER